MAEINQKVIDAYEDSALKGLKAINEFLAYQGNNPDYFKRARVGSVPVTGYGRLRATQANMESTDLLREKMKRRV